MHEMCGASDFGGVEFLSIDWIRGFYVDLSVSADIFIIAVNVYGAKIYTKLGLH